MYTQEQLNEIASKFALEGEIKNIKALGPGFINDTFIIETIGNGLDSQDNSSKKYILQRKNHNVFPDVPAMMNNIIMITEHIKAKVTAAGGDAEREVLTVIKRKEESITEDAPYADLYYKDENGNYWAVCLFIEGSITYEKADTTELAYKGGQGIGRFQAQLADFTTPLAETIKGFHNIRWRFQQWEETLAADPCGRVKDLSEEISWIESRKEEMLEFWSKVEKGEIPTHVTHNDTKISNILFDKDGEVMCVIDLDTCMSSTSLNDFGDAIRSYTNTGKEDDTDLDNVSMSMDMFKAYTEGYLSEKKSSISQIELDYLAFSAKYITFEQVLRFLMDYIDGDKYYKTAYPGHNLVRTRAQYKLLLSIEEQFEQMNAVVKELAN